MLLGGFGIYSGSGSGGGGGGIPSEDMSYGVASGTNTYSVTLSPAITEYSTGLLISVKFTNANTSSTLTLDCNSLGAKTILNRNGGVPYIGQIQAGGVYQLVYDGTNLILQNDPYDGDVSFYRKTGVDTIERWYGSILTTAASTTSARAGNTLNATPFIVPKTITLDRLAMEITGAGTAGSLVRLGIYASTNSIPSDLVLDAGTIAGDSSTFQSITINQTLTPGLYWLTYVHNSSTNITFRAYNQAGQPAIVGWNPTLGAASNYTIYTSSFTFGALPSTFDYTSFSAQQVVPPFFSVRLSA